MEINKTETKDFVEFFSVIKQNYRLILIFISCSCLAVAIGTYSIPRQYTSSTIIYPTFSNSLEDVIRNPQFGSDVEADRLLQLLESRSIRDSIVRKFDLVKYYDIDKSDRDWQFQLTKKFQKDITFTKTALMSLVISARSRDPEMSAQVVNEIILLLSKIREKLFKRNVYIALASFKKEFEALKSGLDSMSGVLNRMTRTRKDVQQYLQTEKYVSLIFDKKQLADDDAGKALQLSVNQYNVKLSWFYDVQNSLKYAALMSQRPLPSVYVIESAEPSYNKSYPNYSINLLIAFSGSSVFISFLLFLIQKIRNILA